MKSLAGFMRDGCGNTEPDDAGVHALCACVTMEFVAFSKARGHELSTPKPDADFSVRMPGAGWCLCALR